MEKVKRSTARPVVITSAERSQDDQLRIRQRRYVTMMLLRAVCLVLAVILVSASPPLVWLWVVLCVVGAVVLPWVAVVLANDRLPKERHRWRRPGAGSGPREIPPAPLNR